MKKKYSILILILTFLIGALSGAISYFLYIDDINKSYKMNIRNLNLESSMHLFWALANNKNDLAKKYVAENIRALEKMIIEDGGKPSIPKYLDSLIEQSLQYKYIGTVYSTNSLDSVGQDLVNKIDEK